MPSLARPFRRPAVILMGKARHSCTKTQKQIDRNNRSGSQTSPLQSRVGGPASRYEHGRSSEHQKDTRMAGMGSVMNALLTSRLTYSESILAATSRKEACNWANSA